MTYFGVPQAFKDGDVRMATSIARQLGCYLERNRAEEQQRLLIQELNHRVKNMLAIVQAVAQQTFKGPSEGEPGPISAFQARLAALAAAHDILTRSSWQDTSLQEVIAQVVAATCGTSPRVRMAGPHVAVTSKAAVMVAMAVNELCSNAIKYGALSNDVGYVELHWNMSSDPDARLRFVWREHGGPPVQAPSRKGFGSRIIADALAQELSGKVLMDFRPEGLICSVEDVPRAALGH